MARTPVNLYAFGSRAKGPRLPRAGIDLFLDERGTVGPEVPPSPDGMSTFADIDQSPLTGHYFVLPAGTELPAGIEVVADGVDVQTDGIHPPTHHTIYPAQRIAWEGFVELVANLPWQSAGKKP